MKSKANDEKLEWKEVYKKRTAFIKKEKLPKVPHMEGLVTVKEAMLIEQGEVSKDGILYGYQVLRLVYKPTSKGKKVKQLIDT